MPARHVLILYGTSYGQTAKIARRMDDLLTASGETVTLVDASHQPRGLTPHEFDAVIVGGSLIRGRHQKSVRRFVRVHRDALNAMPSAFFSVSGAAASRDEAVRADARRFVDEFLGDTGWHPARSETIAGAMAYTKYNPIVRWIVMRASKPAGGPTDTSRDHEFTDWAQVRRFVEAFEATLPAPAALAEAAARRLG
jgi:menaquinone-dependent protoporphyrinogen oxidase